MLSHALAPNVPRVLHDRALSPSWPGRGELGAEGGTEVKQEGCGGFLCSGVKNGVQSGIATNTKALFSLYISSVLFSRLLMRTAICLSMYENFYLMTRKHNAAPRITFLA